MTFIRRITPALCRRHAYDLCRRYGISTGEMAPVFGIHHRKFEDFVLRDGLTLKYLECQNNELTIVRDIMELLMKELHRLQLNDETIPVKTRLDALAQLARTMDRVSEMQQRRSEQQRSVTAFNSDELCKALVRIDERIQELARSRADDLVRRQIQSIDDRSISPGMGDERATESAAAP
ncbi:hypothetical protein HB779_11090 [Phyllobacterium sp. 628]|uniref:hypothetical protein n=1 Tax=Phyllobacterium sp. 628 TaxID=2718938 RepID=UPI0016622FAF|nr:hypothetical protein [Phyllobacterium sp. 628]QND52390.1 hypothetical protein HB779_11090 [Phyllobacterium sp. 628]